MQELTVIDLPGITRVPVDNQPETIYEDVVKLINNYMAGNISLRSQIV